MDGNAEKEKSDNTNSNENKVNFKTFLKGAVIGAVGGFNASVIAIILVFFNINFIRDNVEGMFWAEGFFEILLLFLGIFSWGIPGSLIVGSLAGIVSVDLSRHTKKAFLSGLLASLIILILLFFLIIKLEIF